MAVKTTSAEETSRMEPLGLLISIAGHLRSLIKDRGAKQRDEWDRIAKLCGRLATTVDKMADALDARRPRAELGAACSEFEDLMRLVRDVSKTMGPENMEALRFLDVVVQANPFTLRRMLPARLDKLKYPAARGMSPAFEMGLFQAWDDAGLPALDEESPARAETADEVIEILQLAAAKFRAAEAAFALP